MTQTGCEASLSPTPSSRRVIMKGSPRAKPVWKPGLHPLSPMRICLKIHPSHRSDNFASQLCPRPRNTSEGGWSGSCIWPQIKNCPFINGAGMAGRERTNGQLAPGSKEGTPRSRHRPARRLRGRLRVRPPHWAPRPPQPRHG